MALKLRPYQQDAIERIREKFQLQVNRQVVKMPTGTGKTPVFADLPNQLQFKKRQMVLTHTEELAEQAEQKLRLWNPGLSVGVEMAHRRAGDARLVVASVQTIGRKGSSRLQQFNPEDFDAIVIDECHHAVAQSYRTVLEHFNVWDNTNILCLGVTATVNRADGRGLGEIFEEIVYEMPILRAIREGWLVDLRGVRVKTEISLDDIAKKGDDFDLVALARKVNHPLRNDALVRGWLEVGEDRQTVAYAVDVQHAKDLAAVFRKYGVAAEAIWGDDPARREKLDLHRQKKLRVLVNCQILTEGYDDWQIGCILLARPTQSEGLYTQMVGRGTRLPEGVSNLVQARQFGLPLAKEDCIVIDGVDATQKHSLVTLPTLFGLGVKLDFKGRSVAEVMTEVEEIKAEMPLIDFTQAEDALRLRAWAEEVDLFRVEFSPEIKAISKNQWHRIGEYSYVLPLMNDEKLFVVRDLLGHWNIFGTCNGYRINDRRKEFAEAIEEADFKLRMFGGRVLRAIAKQEAGFHKDPPSPAQLQMCRRLGIKVPPNATRGDVHKVLTRIAADRNKPYLEELKRRREQVA